jgi:hypothetical protein
MRPAFRLVARTPTAVIGAFVVLTTAMALAHGESTMAGDAGNLTESVWVARRGRFGAAGRVR